MAPNDDMNSEIRVRISPGLKKQATEVLSQYGLNISDAVRLFLEQVVMRDRLPFEVKAPNIITIAAMKESRKLTGKNAQSIQQLFDELEKRPK